MEEGRYTSTPEVAVARNTEPGPFVGPINETVADPSLTSRVAEITKVNYGKAVKKNQMIYYPSSLPSQMENGREYMRLKIVSRDLEEKQSIFLLTPPGLSVPDGATWNNVDLGTLMGSALNVAKKGTAALKNLSMGEAAGKVVGVEDLVAASTLTALDKFTPILGPKAMMSAGIAANPYTNTQFSGTNLRTFEFTFKLISENSGESETAKEIENIFRKFLYPRKHPSSDMVLVYPPLWDIGFYKNGAAYHADRNPFMPRLHLLNMTALNVVYNATGNSFHSNGAPTEMDISISFQETKTLTRDDLYGQTDNGPSYEMGNGNSYSDLSFWPGPKEPEAGLMTMNYTPPPNNLRVG